MILSTLDSHIGAALDNLVLQDGKIPNPSCNLKILREQELLLIF